MMRHLNHSLKWTLSALHPDPLIAFMVSVHLSPGFMCFYFLRQGLATPFQNPTTLRPLGLWPLSQQTRSLPPPSQTAFPETGNVWVIEAQVRCLRWGQNYAAKLCSINSHTSIPLGASLGLDLAYKCSRAWFPPLLLPSLSNFFWEHFLNKSLTYK